MRTPRTLLAVLPLMQLLDCRQLVAQNSNRSDVQPPSAESTVASRFDPSRSAAADLETAIRVARKSGKNILVDVGGDWCMWCGLLDRLFRESPSLEKIRDEHLILVRIYYGSDNRNEAVLSRYSKILGIPHFYVLDKDGRLLHSQHVADLQTSGAYDYDKMKAFLLQWSPPARDSASADAGAGAATQPRLNGP